MHTDGRHPRTTDWSQVLALYDQLLTLSPNAVVALNRAIAVGELRGPAAGLAALEAVDTTSLTDYQPYSRDTALTSSLAVDCSTTPLPPTTRRSLSRPTRLSGNSSSGNGGRSLVPDWAPGRWMDSPTSQHRDRAAAGGGRHGPVRMFPGLDVCRYRHLSQWWGPEGFTTTTQSFEFHVGGEWDFVMHGPDGTDYQEWISWTGIDPPERIALLHGESRGDPNAFESVVTFAPDGRGDQDRDPRRVPHQGAARRGGREVPRHRGRPADPRKAGCLRERDHSEGGGRLMAGKVFFSVSMSLDGFIAPGTLGELMGQQWMELQQWLFPQRFFRENLKLGEGGEEEARQRHRPRDVQAHRRERDGQAHV